MVTSRAISLLPAALALLGSASFALPDAQTRCQRDKLSAIAKSIKGVFACSPKQLQGVTLGSFDEACLGEVSPKFVAAWSRAILKAHEAGVSCFNAPSAGSVSESLIEAAIDSSAVIRAGFALSDDAAPAAVTLLNTLMRAGESYMTASLAAHAKDADKPDPSGLAKSLAKALATLEAKTAGAAQKAAAIGIAWTGNAAEIAAALDPHVAGLVLGISTNPGFAIGRLVDSGVSGVDFSPGLDGGPNLTLAGGLFPITGPVMSFSIGGIELGGAEVSATGFVTPVSLVTGAVDEAHPTVTNMARFLQTIDDDGKASNGIAVAAAVREAAGLLSLDFSDTDAVVSLAEQLTPLTSKGAHSAVSALQAQKHLQGALLGAFAGTYAGTFRGDDSGTWQVAISTGGTIKGNGISNDVGKIGIKGKLTSGGALDAVAGSVTTGAVFQGTVDAQGQISGLWVNAKFGESGTFSGSLLP